MQTLGVTDYFKVQHILYFTMQKGGETKKTTKMFEWLKRWFKAVSALFLEFYVRINNKHIDLLA